MQQGLYDNLTKKCKNTIKNNNPKESINIISDMNLPGKKNKIGNENALKIYKVYADESCKYNSTLYKNDINSYKKKVNNNINEAKKYSKNK